MSNMTKMQDLHYIEEREPAQTQEPCPASPPTTRSATPLVSSLSKTAPVRAPRLATPRDIAYRTVLCRHYTQKLRCARGSECVFIHDTELVVAMGKQTTQKAQVGHCYEYVQGLCKRSSEECMYMHPADPRPYMKYTPCALGLTCPRTGSCPMKHPVEHLRLLALAPRPHTPDVEPTRGRSNFRSEHRRTARSSAAPKAPTQSKGRAVRLTVPIKRNPCGSKPASSVPLSSPSPQSSYLGSAETSISPRQRGSAHVPLPVPSSQPSPTPAEHELPSLAVLVDEMPLYPFIRRESVDFEKLMRSVTYEDVVSGSDLEKPRLVRRKVCATLLEPPAISGELTYCAELVRL
ncbi:hypothetical protein BC834DRAFT_897218 [Gloeopeniophorella convolvens]|nr:hypothetical protein BC834DRAFT_897218 [Gloeopeniophorella convolvens]